MFRKQTHFTLAYGFYLVSYSKLRIKLMPGQKEHGK
jgi:hypothetical protein